MTEKQEIKFFPQKPSVGATIKTPCPLPTPPNNSSLNQPDKLEIDILHVRFRLSRIDINSLIQLGKFKNYIRICGSSCSVWGIISLIRRQARA